MVAGAPAWKVSQYICLWNVGDVDLTTSPKGDLSTLKQMLRAVRVSTEVETRTRMNALTQSAPGVRGRGLLSNRLKDHENDAERRTIARKR